MKSGVVICTVGIALLAICMLGCKTESDAPRFSFLKSAEIVADSSDTKDGKFRQSLIYNLHAAISVADNTVSEELSPSKGWGRREIGDLVEFQKDLKRVVLTSGKIEKGSINRVPGTIDNWTTVSITTFK